MSRATRALIGALVGALTVLAAHPKSRPFLLEGTPLAPSAKQVKALIELPRKGSELPQPLTAYEASRWIVAGAKLERAGRRPTVDQYLLLTEIAQQGSRAEPGNAFWAQMESRFLLGALDSDPHALAQSREAWRRASNCETWDDHQADFLAAERRQLTQAQGTSFAWHRSYSHTLRSSAVAEVLLVHSRSLLASAPDSVELRAQTVLNASLIREGTRSIAGATAAVTMMDLAAKGVGRNVRNTGTPRSRHEAQGRLIAELGTESPMRSLVVKAFTDSEAWAAFVPIADYQDQDIWMIRATLLAATAPGTLLMAGLWGLGMYALGWAALSLKKVEVHWRHPVFFVGCAVLGFGTWLATGLVFPALWVFAASLSFGIVPDRLRAGEAESLGPVFGAVHGVLAVFIGLSVATWSGFTSVAARAVGQAAALPMPDDPVGQVPLYLALLATSISVATAPAWGFMNRFRAFTVLPRALKTTGGGLAWGACAASVVLTPFCLVMDSRLAKSMDQILQNEPNYYIVQTR